MRTNLKILQSDREIANGLLQNALPEFTRDFNTALKKLKTGLPPVINKIITKSPVYEGIVSGKLRYDLGIPNGAVKLADLIDAWTRNIVYDPSYPRVYQGQIKAKINVAVFKIDFADVLGLEAAQVYDKIRGYRIPWLEWLAFYGTVPIIRGFDVTYMKTQRSRTGGAVMSTGQNWGVPQQFAGTIDDNWITRSIEAHSSEIEKLLERIF